VLAVLKLWPDKRSDGGVRVAMRFAGSHSDLLATFESLLTTWTADGPPSGRDLLEDLDRDPWSEQADEGVDVVFEGRPGNRMW